MDNERQLRYIGRFLLQRCPSESVTVGDMRLCICALIRRCTQSTTLFEQALSVAEHACSTGTNIRAQTAEDFWYASGLVSTTTACTRDALSIFTCIRDFESLAGQKTNMSNR